MPSLSSHSKHEEFWLNSALQIKNQKKRISKKGKESKNSMNQLNSAGSNGTVVNRMNSAENFATRWNFRYIEKKNFVVKFDCFVFKRLRFGFSPFYPHCNFVVSYCFVISLFLSIYKPQSVTNGHQSLLQ